jgi:hypothetical protein
MSKPGRNDPCPCGSGKKYKHCHWLAEQGTMSESERARRFTISTAKWSSGS